MSRSANLSIDRSSSSGRGQIVKSWVRSVTYINFELDPQFPAYSFFFYIFYIINKYTVCFKLFQFPPSLQNIITPGRFSMRFTSTGAPVKRNKGSSHNQYRNLADLLWPLLPQLIWGGWGCGCHIRSPDPSICPLVLSSSYHSCISNVVPL